MPGYGGPNRAFVLEEGRQVEVWFNEAVAVNGTSMAVKLNRHRSTSYPMSFSVELAFSADPGAFEVDILTADTDQINRYVKSASIATGGLNTYFVGRAEVTNAWCRFLALQLVSIANPAVTLTGLVSR